MLHVGLVGTGGISKAHLNGWRHIPEAELTAVCDIRPEKVDPVGADTGAKVYYTLNDMLSNEHLDVLDICLPTYLHPDTAIQAMNKGLHVLCEKPISLYRDDVQRIYSTAKDNNVRFMVAQCLRFWPEYELLKDAYDTGKYGRLLSGAMTRLGNTPKWSWDNWMQDKKRSGLVPFDLHIHDLDFLIYAFGAPEKVTSHRAGNVHQDYINALYQYKDFFVSTEAAWYDCAYKFQAGFRFQFEKAVMEWKSGVMTIYHQDGTSETPQIDTSDRQNGINLPRSNAYYNEIRYFTDQVLSGKDCDKVKPKELETVLRCIEQL